MNPEDEARIVDPDRLPEEEDLESEDPDDPSVTAMPSPATENDALDDRAHGRTLTADDAEDGIGEVDAMGKAAGLPRDGDQPFTKVIEAVERRDDKRWELDPRSSEDYPDRKEDLAKGT